MTATHIALRPFRHLIPERFYTSSTDDTPIVLFKQHIAARKQQAKLNEVSMHCICNRERKLSAARDTTGFCSLTPTRSHRR